MKLKTLLIIAVILLVITLLREIARPCELFCFARTDLQADSRWETNDIVNIYENGTIANAKLKKSNAFMFSGIFYFVYVPDLSVSEAKNKYLKPRYDTNGKEVANREYKINTTKITIIDGQAITDKATFAGQLTKKPVQIAEEP